MGLCKWQPFESVFASHNFCVHLLFVQLGLCNSELVTEFVLQPLDIDECTALISTIVGERVKAQFSHEISDVTLCAIHARSGGIPAYVKELSSALKEALFTSSF